MITVTDEVGNSSQSNYLPFTINNQEMCEPMGDCSVPDCTFYDSFSQDQLETMCRWDGSGILSIENSWLTLRGYNTSITTQEPVVCNTNFHSINVRITADGFDEYKISHRGVELFVYPSNGEIQIDCAQPGLNPSIYQNIPFTQPHDLRLVRQDDIAVLYLNNNPIQNQVPCGSSTSRNQLSIRNFRGDTQIEFIELTCDR